MLRWVVAITLVLGAILLVQQVHSCNEAVCGSIVSKCLLTQSCKCDLKNCTCCKECFSCLHDLFSECCSCVDMCSPSNETSSSLNKKSHVEDFAENEQHPSLFQSLTQEPDSGDRWTSYTFPVNIDPIIGLPKKEIKLHLQSVDQQHSSINCTVAFMSTCISWEKCRSNCRSMGSASYRWFHDGCCECVGASCINYGVNESMCRKCPLSDNEDPDDEFVDYGDSEEFEDD